MTPRLLAVIAAILFAALGRPASAQGTVLPWGQSSDMIAWQTFAQLMAPAGEPGSKLVEFETWATDSDIYGQSTPRWPQPGTPKRLQQGLLGGPHAAAGLRPLAIGPGQCAPPADAAAGNFPPRACIGEEVRRNWASFRYIVANGLYSYEGLAQAHRNRLKVDMPADSIEFKGDWVRVPDLIAWLKRVHGLTLDGAAVRKQYYVATVTDGLHAAEFALVSIHFSTKQIKNWVWADFEHRLNPGRCDDIGCHDSFGALEPDVRPRTPANGDYGACAKSPKLQAMFEAASIDPVWLNYCLKGSETDFVQPNGRPRLLGDSVVERIDAATPVRESSCTTCHAYAAFDRNGDHPLIYFVGREHPVGAVDPARLKGMVQNDFVWGLAKMPPRR